MHGVYYNTAGKLGEGIELYSNSDLCVLRRSSGLVYATRAKEHSDVCVDVEAEVMPAGILGLERCREVGKPRRDPDAQPAVSPVLATVGYQQWHDHTTRWSAGLLTSVHLDRTASRPAPTRFVRRWRYLSRNVVIEGIRHRRGRYLWCTSDLAGLGRECEAGWQRTFAAKLEWTILREAVR